MIPRRPVEWECCRCGETVDMVAFRCGCESSPSPWQPVTTDSARRWRELRPSRQLGTLALIVLGIVALVQHWIGG